MAEINAFTNGQYTSDYLGLEGSVSGRRNFLHDLHKLRALAYSCNLEMSNSLGVSKRRMTSGGLSGCGLADVIQSFLSSLINPNANSQLTAWSCGLLQSPFPDLSKRLSMVWGDYLRLGVGY